MMTSASVGPIAEEKKVGWIVTSLLVHIKLSTWKSSELGMVTFLNQCTSK